MTESNVVRAPGLDALEKLFAVVMLFYTTGATLTYVIARLHGSLGLAPSRIELLMEIAFHGVALCFIALRWRSVLRAAWRVKWILALLAVTFASTAWSQDPSITLRRSLVLFATTLFGLYFATRFDLSEQLRLIAWACGLVIFASFLFVIFLPRLGVDQTFHVGDWQGAFYQKNMLARAMVLSALVFFYARFRSIRILHWFGLAGSLVLLVFSRSVTGMVVCLGILAVMPAYRLLRTRFSFGIPVFLGFVGIGGVSAAALYGNLPALLQLVHRDEGLTGRFELWNAVLMSIAKHPWLGYGFSAFWLGLKGESANVLLTVKWSPGYAHNGFLDLVLDTGVLGLAVFLAGYLAFWKQSMKLVARTSRRLSFWFCAYLLFVLFYNLTEGPALSQNNISWVLYVATAVDLSLYMPERFAVPEEEFEPEEMEAIPEGVSP